MIQPGDSFSKTGKPVLDVLWSKHQWDRAPSTTSLDAYPIRPPELVPVGLTEDTVIEVARPLLGGAGLGGAQTQ